MKIDDPSLQLRGKDNLLPARRVDVDQIQDFRWLKLWGWGQDESNNIVSYH